MVVEGLGVMFLEAVKLEIFKGFSLGESSNHILHLQFMDDTLILRERSSKM